MVQAGYPASESPRSLSKVDPVAFPMEETWDYLIILDACRYDYFEKFYSLNIQGNLYKRISPATCTRDWLVKVFKDYYDNCVYVSANANVNNSPTSDSKLKFTASQHFFKVIEVWKSGWSEKFGTVHPDEVNKSVIRAIAQNNDKKFIIHYMQPHYPYFASAGVKVRGHFEHKFIWVVRNLCTHILGTNIGVKLANKIAPNDEEFVAKQIGFAKLRQCYEQNLQTVLQSVADLLSHLQGKIVITSDHGDLLGEEELCGHPCGFYRMEALTEIPWLEIHIDGLEQSAAVELAPDEILTKEEEDIIHKRLEAFGYG